MIQSTDYRFKEAFASLLKELVRQEQANDTHGRLENIKEPRKKFQKEIIDNERNNDESDSTSTHF